ncbi:MAG: SpoIID/LytB domain-containing protein [Gemmatimonadota bacterium]
MMRWERGERWEWVAVLALLLAGCRLGETTPTAPTTPDPGIGRPGAEPTVRVGIKLDTAAVFVSATGASTVVDRDGNIIARPGAGRRWTFTSDSANRITATSDDGESIASNAASLTWRVPNDAFVTIGERTYRGDVVVRTAGPGRVSAINVLEMEHYLLGVVPYEIGRLGANLIEATKAQALAARTYAIANMGSKNALGFDFYATVADQVYNGTMGEDTVVTRAVLETRGEIISHSGRPIIAYYSSTCGGHTADANESWPWRPPQPYLVGKPDLDPNGEAYCKASNRFRWAVSWAGDSLRAILQTTLRERLRNPALRIDRLEDVRVIDTTKSGRVELEILADGQSHRIRTDSIRWTLRPTPTGSLNSSLLFEVAATKSAGEVSRLDVRGGGWGHGVGMCQVGAIGRARAGQNYRDILRAYYTDVDITRLY